VVSKTPSKATSQNAVKAKFAVLRFSLAPDRGREADPAETRKAAGGELVHPFRKPRILTKEIAWRSAPGRFRAPAPSSFWGDIRERASAPPASALVAKSPGSLQAISTVVNFPLPGNAAKRSPLRHIP
jgi:hypothetical protein